MAMRASFHDSLDDTPAAVWDELVPPDEPFLRHAFLTALAQSGSVGPGTGWAAHHLQLHDGSALQAALPLYAKTDSYGEFIFDWSWAQGALSAGLAYYPKLVAAVPFTPATGARLLLAPGTEAATATAAAAEALRALLAQGHFSSAHILFCSQKEQARWASCGFVARESFQFHWQRGPRWHCFDDFLAALRSPSRKQIKKERARARSHGLTLAMEPAFALCAEDVARIYGLYRQTVWEKGAQAYLTGEFFAGLLGPLAQNTLVATARDACGIVAMALYFRAGKNLYGRYWGAFAALDSLHFELCYYLPIEWSLAHGIERFEAGAQGEHKLKRGLLPSACHSAHLMAHPGLQRAVAGFCRQEAEGVAASMASYAAQTPFGRGGAESVATVPSALLEP